MSTRYLGNKISIGIEYWPADKLSIAQWLERRPSNPAVGGRGFKPWRGRTFYVPAMLRSIQPPGK